MVKGRQGGDGTEGDYPANCAAAKRDSITRPHFTKEASRLLIGIVGLIVQLVPLQTDVFANHGSLRHLD